MNPELSQHANLFVTSKGCIRLGPWNTREGGYHKCVVRGHHAIYLTQDIEPEY
jgi:hypothetical protein